MARCRDLLGAALLLGAMHVTAAAAAMPGAVSPGSASPPVTGAQYFAPERQYAPPPRYAPRPPPRRRVCWTERRRIFVGYDQWGRALYRSVPRRVCGWRYY